MQKTAHTQVRMYISYGIAISLPVHTQQIMHSYVHLKVYKLIIITAVVIAKIWKH